MLRKPACSALPQPIYLLCQQMLTFSPPHSPHTPTLLWWDIFWRSWGSFGEGGDCGGCGGAGAGDDGAGTRSVGWHCALIFLAAPHPLLPSNCTICCTGSSVNIVHLANTLPGLCSMILCPGGTIWVKATRPSSRFKAPKPKPSPLHCTNAHTAPAPMASLPPTLKYEANCHWENPHRDQKYTKIPKTII